MGFNNLTHKVSGPKAEDLPDVRASAHTSKRYAKWDDP